MPIDTRRVTGRRTLRFDTLDDIVRDAEALAARGPDGYRALGNYTLGQVAAHLAQGMEYCLDGYPPMRVPVVMKVFGRLMRPWVTRVTPPAGMRLSPELAAAFRAPDAGSPDATTEAGLARLRRAVERMKAEPPSGGRRVASPMFGRLSRAQWDALHCRHAELHLSFIVPG